MLNCSSWDYDHTWPYLFRWLEAKWMFFFRTVLKGDDSRDWMPGKVGFVFFFVFNLRFHFLRGIFRFKGTSKKNNNPNQPLRYTWTMLWWQEPREPKQDVSFVLNVSFLDPCSCHIRILSKYHNYAFRRLVKLKLISYQKVPRLWYNINHYQSKSLKKQQKNNFQAKKHVKWSQSLLSIL